MTATPREQRRKAVRVFRFVHEPREELDRLTRRLIRPDARQTQSAFARGDPERPSRSRRGAATRHAASRPTRSGEGSVDGAPKRIIAVRDGRQLGGTIQEERSRPQPTTSPGVVCGLLQHARNVLVLLVDRRCELPRTSFSLLEELGEPRVHLDRRSGFAPS